MRAAAVDEAPGALGAQRKAWLWRLEVGRVWCESTEDSKRLFFLVYDFTYNYSSYIILLCWPSSFALQVSPHPFPPYSVSMSWSTWSPLTGVPWTLASGWAWPIGGTGKRPREWGEWGQGFLSQLSSWWQHAAQFLSASLLVLSTQLHFQFYSTFPFPVRCRI